MSIINEDDAVGYFMEVTLVNDVTYQGTVYTYNPEEGVLVLLQNLSEPQPSMKMIRTCFIKKYEMKSDEGNTSLLPRQLEPFTTLPSMHAGRDKSIFKHASVQLKQAEGNRSKIFSEFEEDTPIAACDAFVKVARLYPDISWLPEDKVIRVTNDVIITPTPDWTNPTAELVAGANEREKSLVERIQKALDGGAKK